jgi:F0F1-type ATP synthase membrane subunit b/b'
MSNQKRGFRLPWAADRDPDGSVQTAEGDAPARDLLPHGEAGPAPENEDESMDAVPAASDVPEGTAEAEMFDTETPSAPSAKGARPEEATWGASWPSSDRAPSTEEGDAVPRTDFGAPADSGSLAALDSLSGATTTGDQSADGKPSDKAPQEVARPPIRVATEPPAGRRENPLVAGLVKAMREAAIASRDDTIARLQADAETRVTSIRGRATSEAAELKQRAENDISEIRDWSKAEIARIREETESRIEARKTDLAGETERHAASVERLVEDVQSVVATFETDMDAFFQRLLAENDPARLAALAEQAPDAPDLSGDGPAALDLLDDAIPEPTPPDGLGSAAAAAAEVAASEGLDMGESQEWPAAVIAASRREDVPMDSIDPDAGATRLLVSGLGSVAGISALKGALGQLPGVHGVSVSSGERGEFVFAITHEPGLDLATGVSGLPGFAARITDATDDGITVVAHEPVA